MQNPESKSSDDPHKRAGTPLPPPESQEIRTPDAGVFVQNSRAEALSRWDAVLDQSPVFADPTKPAAAAPAVQSMTDLGAAPGAPPAWPIVAPMEAYPQQLEVAIDALFGVSSAPGESDPAVDLLVTLTPNGPPLLDPKAGPVTHLVLALDISASMNTPDKYPVLTRALSGMLTDLRKDDAVSVLLSVVVFAHGSEVLFREVPAKDLSPRQLLDALDQSQLRFTRYTDLVGALGRAGRLAHDSVQKNKALPVRIYVLTDGRPQDVSGARIVMERIHKLPVDIDGLSFGDDADIACLSSLISGSRGGTVKHVRPDTIEVAFGRIGDVAQRVIAPRAILDLELRSGVVGGAAYRFRPARYRYGDDAFDMGRHFSRDLGTLESGRSYWLLFQVRLPVAKGTETEVGRLTLRVAGFGGARVFEKLVSISRHNGRGQTSIVAEVAAARDVVDAIDNDDPMATLKALKMRKELYESEHRDRHVIDVLDRAIAEIERHGNLAALSQGDQAVLISHTLTKRGSGKASQPAGETASS